MTPDDILADHSAESQHPANLLRARIHADLPGMTERAYPGWHGIGFRHARAGYVCGLFPTDERVRLLFEKGRLLSDPERLLEGDGTQTRYINFRPGDTLPGDSLTQLLQEAIAL